MSQSFKPDNKAPRVQLILTKKQEYDRGLRRSPKTEKDLDEIEDLSDLDDDENEESPD